MKKLLAIFLTTFVLFSGLSLAEGDLSKYSEDELLSQRQAINDELAKRNKEKLANVEGKTLIEMFPDKNLAIIVRDATGLISIEHVPTQEQLDTVTLIPTGHEPIADLTGIGTLRKLKYFNLNRKDTVEVLPEELFTLEQLQSFSIPNAAIKELPEALGNLTELTEINIRSTEIAKLPESIGNLKELKRLNISHTKITELPESIFTLELKSFERDGLSLNIE